VDKLTIETSSSWMLNSFALFSRSSLILADTYQSVNTTSGMT